MLTENRKGGRRGVLTFLGSTYPNQNLSGPLHWFSLPSFPPSLSTPPPLIKEFLIIMLRKEGSGWSTGGTHRVQGPTWSLIEPDACKSKTLFLFFSFIPCLDEWVLQYYSWTSHKQPPKMQRLCGRLREVVAYKNWTTGALFWEEVWAHLLYGR